MADIKGDEISMGQRNDPIYMAAAIKQDPALLLLASRDLKKNADFLRTIGNASDSQEVNESDSDFMVTVGIFVEFIRQAYLKDRVSARKIMADKYNGHTEMVSLVNSLGDNHLASFVGKVLKTDRGFISEIIKASDQMKDNTEFLLAMFNQIEDKELVLKEIPNGKLAYLLEQDGNILRFIPEDKRRQVGRFFAPIGSPANDTKDKREDFSWLARLDFDSATNTDLINKAINHNNPQGLNYALKEAKEANILNQVIRTLISSTNPVVTLLNIKPYKDYLSNNKPADERSVIAQASTSPRDSIDSIEGSGLRTHLQQGNIKNKISNLKKVQFNIDIEVQKLTEDQVSRIDEHVQELKNSMKGIFYGTRNQHLEEYVDLITTFKNLALKSGAAHAMESINNDEHFKVINAEKSNETYELMESIVNENSSPKLTM